MEDLATILDTIIAFINWIMSILDFFKTTPPPPG